MGIASLVAQRTNTLNNALAVSQYRFENFFLVLRWRELQDLCSFTVKFWNIPLWLPTRTAVFDDVFADLFKQRACGGNSTVRVNGSPVESLRPKSLVSRSIIDLKTICDCGVCRTAACFQEGQQWYERLGNVASTYGPRT